MTTSAPERAKASVLRDVLSGALQGDFAKHLGPAGALTQMVLGYVPVVGTLAAVRDLLADLSQGDLLGMLLNIIAIFPVFGGFAKTAEVLHHLRRLQHSLQTNGVLAASRPDPAELTGGHEGGHGPTFFGLMSLLLGVVAPLASPALALYGLTSLAPALGLSTAPQRLSVVIVGVFLAPVLGILTGHLGSARVRRKQGRHSPRPLVRVGLALGYIYLIGFAAALALVLAVHPVQ